MTIPAALLMLFLQMPQPAKASIEGHVLLAGSNEPIAKALVSVVRIGDPRSGASIAPVTSDDQGRFRLKDLEPGTYVVKAQRNGFAWQEFGESAPGRPGIRFNIAAGQVVQDVVFRLVSGGAISGRVTDAGGEPISGVPVSIERPVYGPNGKRTLEVVGTSRTNDHGDYRVYWITPGRYYAVVKPLDSGSDEITEAGYVATHYPNTTDKSAATAIDVEPGAEIRAIDFTLRRQSVFRVRGRLADAGKGFSPDLIWVVSKNGVLQEGEISNGVFEIRNIVPGSYQIQANSGEIKSAIGRVEVIDADVEGVLLPPYTGFTIKGRVQFEGESLSFKPDGQSTGLYLIEDSLDEHGYAGIEPDGTFTVNDLAPGDYRLSVLAMPPDTYIKSARLGGKDVRNGLSVTGPVSESLELLVSTRAGQLEGTVVDKDRKPMAGKQVVLLPLREADRVPGRVKAAASDQNGHFILRIIPPGEYKLFAWEDLEPYGYFDPDFVRKYEELGRPVTISGDSALSVELTITPAN